MRICPVCSYENPSGVLTCEQCGASLLPSQPLPRVTRPLRPAQLERVFTVTETRECVFTDQTQLVLNLGNAGQPVFVLRDNEQITFGRGLPTLDLPDDVVWESGMSRVHAAIRRKGDQLYVVDLGSTNGTFVNNERLDHNQPRLLHDGDVLCLGLLDMRVRYIEET